MLHAVIFDLDGTLLDTIDSMAEAGNLMLHTLGLPEQPRDAYRYFAGDGARMLVIRALEAAGSSTNSDAVDAALQLYMKFFAKTCTHNVRFYDGIIPLLEELSRRHIRTAVLSNKPHEQAVDVVASLFKGIHRFDFVQGQTAQVPRKPDPAGVYALLKNMDLTPDDCLYVGDTNVDMQTGRAAGLETAGVLWGFRDEKELRDNHADHIISHPLEMLNLLD